MVVGGYSESLLADMKPFTLDLETLCWRCWPGLAPADRDMGLQLPAPRQRMAANRITKDWLLISGGCPASVRNFWKMHFTLTKTFYALSSFMILLIFFGRSSHSSPLMPRPDLQCLKFWFHHSLATSGLVFWVSSCMQASSDGVCMVQGHFLDDLQRLHIPTLTWGAPPDVLGQPSRALRKISGHTFSGLLAFGGCIPTIMGIMPVEKVDLLLLGQPPSILLSQGIMLYLFQIHSHNKIAKLFAGLDYKDIPFLSEPTPCHGVVSLLAWLT